MLSKTSKLQGAALDWAVAECIYEPDDVVICDGRVFAYDDATKGFNPPTNWAQGGPIIEREKLCITASVEGDWTAFCVSDEMDMQWICRGPTPLIAAMRCYVASKMGDEVDVPDELVKE
jgi:hypothetical protein